MAKARAHSLLAARAHALLATLAVAAVVTIGAACLAPAALAQETRTHLTVLGFDKDYTHMLVKIDDNNVGLAIRLYSTETGKPAKRSRLIEYLRGQQASTIKRARRKYKIKDHGIEAMATEDEKIAFFSVEKDGNCVIAATDFKRLGKITAVPLKEDADTKVRAKGMLKSIHWSTDRKFMVLVVNQKLKGAFVSDSDELHAMKFRKSKIAWVEADKKEEEKEEESSWWQFWK